MAALFWLTLGFMVYVVLAAEDVARGTLISACINPVVAACVWGNTRQRTQAGVDGLRIVGPLKSRRIRWSDVAEVTTPRTRWREHWVQVDLTDGTSVHPIGVPVSAVEELEAMRQRAHS